MISSKSDSTSGTVSAPSLSCVQLLWCKCLMKRSGKAASKHKEHCQNSKFIFPRCFIGICHEPLSSKQKSKKKTTTSKSSKSISLCRFFQLTDFIILIGFNVVVLLHMYIDHYNWDSVLLPSQCCPAAVVRASALRSLIDRDLSRIAIVLSTHQHRHCPANLITQSSSELYGTLKKKRFCS